jgi:hypothetical protein
MEAGCMTDRHDERDRERRERREAREDAERRQGQLMGSWRRNHPSEEDERKSRPKRGRPV